MWKVHSHSEKKRTFKDSESNLTLLRTEKHFDMDINQNKHAFLSTTLEGIYLTYQYTQTSK